MINEILGSLSALPHRYSTSPNERRAAEYLKQKLTELSLEPELDPFVAPTTFSWIYFFLYLGFLLAVIVGAYHPVVAFLIALALVVLFVGEQTTRFSPLSKWVPQGLSHNVIARMPGPAQSAKTLVLCAHYDTSKTALIFHPKFTAGLRRAYLISLLMIALILVGGAARMFTTPQLSRIIGYVLWAPAGYMVFMCLGMLEREVRGKPVNGAADNASGVAIVMELTKRLQARGGLPDREVIVLLTGSEEVGLTGMSHFMAESGQDLDPRQTLFLNFDNVGGGRVTYTRGEGMLFHLASDSRLLAIADRLVKEDPRFKDVQTRVFDALTLDTLVPRARGFGVMTVMGLTDAGVAFPWHWFNDTLENLDHNVVNLAAEFGWEIINQLALRHAE